VPRKQRVIKPLLLGESPSKSGDRYHMFPLSGRVAKTLCELAGIPPQEDGSTYGRWTWALYEHFECANLFARYAHAIPWQGDLATVNFARLIWDARFDVDRDATERERPRTVVCLGRKVQAAALDWFDGHLALGGDDFYDWNIGERRTDRGLVDLVAIPHPSGLNRLLNDPAERERCGLTLREAMERSNAS
jgi:hypothetical protein